MKICTVVGARPQFVKAAVVSRELRKVHEEILVHTGQHYDARMSGIFFDDLEIPHPDYNLGVGSGSHGAQTAQMLIGIEEVLLATEPDCLLVYGDTNSTLAGALAAAKLHIPVAHVEAGLRSFNRRMPEEINRVVTDHLAALLFAPTDTAVRHLAAEGISFSTVHQVGDVMYDASIFYAAKAEVGSHILEELALDPERYLLATVHRAENTDHPLRLQAILGALQAVSRELTVVLPLHPRTRKIIAESTELSVLTEGIRIIEPVGYLDMIRLEQQTALIVTDSGGVQKEAFFFRTPCVTLRDETEWVELVETGWNRLCPPVDSGTIRQTILAAVGTAGREGNLYGEGDASQRIASIISAA